MSPKGKVLNHEKAMELSRYDQLIVLCGHYEGVDQRIVDEIVDEEISIGDYVLTGGEIPPNPAELLEAEEFTRLLDELKTRYDYIFIDTPPITVVTDATIVMKHCVGVAVVVRKDITSFHLLDATMNEIAKTEAKPLGFVLLGSADAKGKYGSYKKSKYAGKGYDYKYGYSYGDSTDGAEEQ